MAYYTVGLRAHVKLYMRTKTWNLLLFMSVPGLRTHFMVYVIHFYSHPANSDKPVGELARVLLSFKRPTLHHRTATVPTFAICTWG